VEPTPFHAKNTEDFLKAKYWCIVKNMEGTPYKVLGVLSQQYKEIYQIQTPQGCDSFEINYRAGGIFSHANPKSINENTSLVLMLLDGERQMPFVFDYIPSDDIHEKLYNLVRSACDGLCIQITNVIEKPNSFYVTYYLRTSNSYSYIRIYIDGKGFVTHAKPMSMLGMDDNELLAVINEISNHFI
jgi:hypothetical protein